MFHPCLGLVDTVFASNHLAVSWFEDCETELTDVEVLERAQLEFDAAELEQIRQKSMESIQAISEVCG